MADADLAPTTPLVRTKLHRPPLGAGLVRRDRLFDALERGRDASLILVSAPAGYGKSVLVNQWAESTERPCAWLSLDDGDRDLPTFVAYLVASIRTQFPEAFPELELMLHSPNPVPAEVMGRCLVNEIDALESGFALVLDDYHRIATNSAVHDLMSFLLEHPPLNLHLVLVTRGDPPLPLASLRASHTAVEVRLRDLQFDLDETSRFVAAATEVNLGKAALAKLQEETEGWAVGLRFVMLHLPYADDPEAFLAGLSGNVRRSQDYLLQEVLADQTPAMQECLLKASILDRFNASLLDAVFVDGPSGASFLKTIMANDLFAIALDHQGQWYRYHHLFQELLVGRLRKDASSEEIAELHRRASHWFEDDGLVEEALQHAVASGDEVRAAELVERHHEAEFLADRWYVVERWLNRLPESVKLNRPSLVLTEAWIAYYRLQHERVAMLAERAEPFLGDPDAKPDLVAALAFFRGFWLYFSGDGPGSLAEFEKSVAICDGNESFCDGVASVFLTIARGMIGEHEAGIRSTEQRIKRARTPDGLCRAHLYIGLGLGHLFHGDLQAIRSVSASLMEIGARLRFGNSELWGVYLDACARLHAGDLEEAVMGFATVINRRYIFDPTGSCDSMIGLALAQQLLGRETEADAALDQLDGFAAETGDLACQGMAVSIRHRIASIRGRDLTASLEWEYQIIGDPAFYELVLWLEVSSISRARVLVASGGEADLEKAGVLLAGLRTAAEGAHFVNQTIEILTLQVMARHRLGRADEAQELLGELLDLAVPRGWMRPFLEAGPEMMDLLQRRSRHADAHEFVGRVLAAAGQARRYQPAVNAEAAAEMPSLEELTNREHDVLQLLAGRLRDKEIADQLCISAHTVNYHLKQVYQKLQVHGRREAVTRALKLGILNRHDGD